VKVQLSGDAGVTAVGLDWAQLGKDEALRLVLPNQDPFASVDPFQDPAATAAARRTAARRARGGAPAVASAGTVRAAACGSVCVCAHV
jgi:hypothetical protein